MKINAKVPEPIGFQLAPMLDDPNYVHNPIHQEQLKLNRFTGQPVWVSEYGGLQWSEGDREDAWGYGNAPKSFEEFVERYKGLTDALLDNYKMGLTPDDVHGVEDLHTLFQSVVCLEISG